MAGRLAYMGGSLTGYVNECCIIWDWRRPGTKPYDGNNPCTVYTIGNMLPENQPRFNISIELFQKWKLVSGPYHCLYKAPWPNNHLHYASLHQTNAAGKGQFITCSLPRGQKVSRRFSGLVAHLLRKGHLPIFTQINWMVVSKRHS